MNALHTKKVEAEKNAFIDSLFSNIPSKDKFISGEFGSKARAIHKVFLPVYIMKYYNTQCYESKYLDVIITNVIESECLLFLGIPNATFTSLRSAVEAAFKFLYYEYHPIERILHLNNAQHSLSSKEYREFFYIFPGLRNISFLSRDSIEALWTNLCKYVHSDLQTIKHMTLLSSISVEVFQNEREYEKVLDILKLVVKLLISILFAVNAAWAKDIEKVYYDAIFEAFSINEREELRQNISIY